MADTPVVMVAHDLGLQTEEGWAYRDVDLVIEPGSVVAVVGSPGGGRSILLRTLVGRELSSHGSVKIFHQGSWLSDQDALQARVVMAELPEHIANDPSARIAECVADQLLLTGIPRRTDVFDTAAEIVGFQPGQDAVVAELPLLQQRLLSLALALTSPVTLIAIDSIDAGLTRSDGSQLWTALHNVAATGVAVVAGTAAPPAAAAADQTIVVDAPQHSR